MPVCPACRGQKKIQGMGSMGEVDCKTCKGTGLEPVAFEIKSVEPVVEQKVETLEIKSTNSSSNKTAEIKPTDTWSSDALTMKGGGIGKSETLELEMQEEIQSNEIKHEEPKHHETKLERFKRKYTKSTK